MRLLQHRGCAGSPRMNLRAWQGLEVRCWGEREDGTPAPCWNCPGCGSTISGESLEPAPCRSVASPFADVPVAVRTAVESALAVGQPGHVGVVARHGEVVIEGAPDAVAGELLGAGFVADLYVRGKFRWRDATVADAAGMS